jgi:antitoxin component HigA of HigAB toxin-antitoxin module
MAIKTLTLEDYPALTGEYCYIQRVADGYILENSSVGGHTLGAFYSKATVTNKALPLTEDANLPGVYAATENRVAFNDGKYVVRYCRSNGTILAVEYWDVVGDAVTGAIDANVVSQANIDFGALQKTSLNAATPASVQNIPATGSGFTALGDTRIANLDAAITSRLASAGYAAPPAATAIRTEMDSNSTKLAHLDADVSSRLASAGYTAPPAATAIRTEMDSNSIKLAHLDADISSRSSHNAADIWAVGTRTLTSFGTLVADIATAVWGAVTRTLTAISDSSGITTLLSRIASALTITGGKVDVNDKTGFAISGTKTTLDALNDITAASVWAVGTRTLSSFGTLVADIATAVWGAATRTLTAISDSAGITTLLSRIAAALTITSGKVDVNDKTGFALTSAYDPAKTAPPSASDIAVAVEQHIINESDGEQVLKAITDKIAAVDPSLSGLSLSAIAAAVRTELTTELARIDAAITSRLASAGYAAPPAATAIRTEMDSNSTKLAHLDADVSSRLASAGYTAPPAATAIRTEMDSNSIKLAHLDADISSRSSHNAADIWAVGTRTLTSFGTLVADIATAVWGAATRTLTAISDSSGITTLLSRIASALTITSGKVDVNDKTGFAISGTKTTLDALNDITAASVWAVGTRTLSSFGTLVADIATAVWGAATRTLTAISDSSGITTLLSRIASALTITGGKVDVNDKTGFAISGTKTTLDALNDITAASVWAVGTRTLTSFGTLVADIAAAVWAAATRTLTAISDSSGITTLLSRIAAALTITSGKVDVNDKTGFALTSAYDAAKTAGSATVANQLEMLTVIDKLDGMLEADGVVSRFTANALEETPVGNVSSLIFPVMRGTVYSATAQQRAEIRIMRGDTPQIPFDLGADYAGWTARFAGKASLDDTTYAMAIRDCTWIDDTKGRGYFDLTAEDTVAAGRVIGEIELSWNSSRLTAMRFLIVILEDIIK